MDDEAERHKLRRLISDHLLCRSLADCTLRSNPHHAFRSDLERVIKHCDLSLVSLRAELKKL